jgi:hypothetical protein
VKCSQSALSVSPCFILHDLPAAPRHDRFGLLLRHQRFIIRDLLASFVNLVAVNLPDDLRRSINCRLADHPLDRILHFG